MSGMPWHGPKLIRVINNITTPLHRVGILPLLHTQRHTHTQPCTHTHIHRRLQTDTHTNTPTHKHTCTHCKTYIHGDSQPESIHTYTHVYLAETVSAKQVLKMNRRPKNMATKKPSNNPLRLITVSNTPFFNEKLYNFRYASCYNYRQSSNSPHCPTNNGGLWRA